MTSFIIMCAVMLVAAIALVAYPLLRPTPQAVKGQPVLPPATIPVLIIGLGLVLGAAAMYHHSSNFPWKNPEAAAAAPAGHGDGGTSGGSMEAVMKQLEARLQANPVDLEGWRMLARTYLVTGQAGKAVDAYEKAIQIAGDSDPSLKLDLAEALVLTNEAPLQERAKGIFAAALAADPNSQKALWYTGVIAIRAGDKQTAIRCWSKLLEQSPPDEIRQILVAQLAELGVVMPAAAQAASRAPAVAPVLGAQGGDAAAPAPQGRTIRVAVSVDPSLAGKVPPGTTLFVSAREPGIPGPPLAAVRMTSDVLPTTVVLSDANSMIEGRNLSSVGDVEVVAHVALAGAPMTSSGDLVGTAIQKKGGAVDIKVAIDKVQP